MATGLPGICFINKREKRKMSNFKVSVQHEHEEKIAEYCAKNNIDFNLANAYDIVLETFKNQPIIYLSRDNVTGEETKHTVTDRIARTIECQIRMVERISEKAALKKINLERDKWNNNIAKAELANSPNIEKLVDNLYKLNIVDGDSYLALICFLMQLKYTRNNLIPENDKTCVFFNGVARNGKSATARAICDIETQYGSVFCAKSGKILESTHEEQVWKSHLNYFDEVKPTDIDRELLLNIINGGEVEINPKNKKQYNYFVNTNNIFTSNDQISLKQRRVSVVKFGNRLNGRPLGQGTLKEIINNIMISLPGFEHYFNLYGLVSKHNETRINPLAMESIITFLTNKIGFVDEEDSTHKRTLVKFAPHDIYNCIKGTYNKQIITSERKEAILTALEFLCQKGLVTEQKYQNCSTRHFRVYGEDYVKIVAEFDKVNTAREVNRKISKTELFNLLIPFFRDPASFSEDFYEADQQMAISSLPPLDKGSKIMDLIDKDIYFKTITGKEWEADGIAQTDLKRGTYLYYKFQREFEAMPAIFEENLSSEEVLIVADRLLTPELSNYVSLSSLIYAFDEQIEKSLIDEKTLTEIYKRKAGLSDDVSLKEGNKLKYDCNKSYHSDGVVFPSSSY